MIADFHFLRPYWFLLLIPLIFLVVLIRTKKTSFQVWQEVCDPHLLRYLLKDSEQATNRFLWLILGLSGFFMILSLAGPSWEKLPVPSYKEIKPRIILLDMSSAMLANDLSPDRLQRAKFKLHDLFQSKYKGQFALIAYSAEPFVVSPLTEDSQTIDALLQSLTPDVIPVEGQNLGSALQEAHTLFKQAGYVNGDILVMTSSTPTEEDRVKVENLARQGIDTSILPILHHPNQDEFQEFAAAGKGEVLILTDESKDIEQWLNNSRRLKSFGTQDNNEIYTWKDEGRWFLIPALILWMPLFRKGWLQQVDA
jgi:Ca-activated chloride channel family protein